MAPDQVWMYLGVPVKDQVTVSWITSEGKNEMATRLKLLDILALRWPNGPIIGPPATGKAEVIVCHDG
jgi:hypothetical protein